ncbi:hypothetical protein AB4Z48_28600 [Cupriavidus sp. 2TAF22]|uniref:hypothetical protein n=1 Tax=unclassified Cupriavidus TaxID=2640874 RepID=UPI003F8F925F
MPASSSVLRRVVPAMLVWLGFAGGAQAYEMDFHYGLTYWLAGQAGFDGGDSRLIAAGDERSDTGMLDAVHAMLYSLCVRHDQTASALTRELHFRSQHPPPAEPANRVVDARQPFAAIAVEAVTGEHGSEAGDRLTRLGQALHGWQDSFSHGGEPSTGPCDRLLMWAHPAAKGGALSHDADLTYKYPDQCRSAARATFERLLAYRRAQRLPKGKATWDRLEPRVDVFCHAATKADKAGWLKGEGVPDPDAIVRGLSLNDGGEPQEGPAFYRGARVPLAEPRAVTQLDASVNALAEQAARQARAEVDKDEAQWVERFMQAWLTTSVAELGPVLSPFFGAGAKMSAESPPIRALARLRLRDRGLANDPGLKRQADGGGSPVYVTASPADWRSLLVRPRSGEQAIFVAHAAGRDSPLVAIAVLEHAPYDVLMLWAARDGASLIVKQLEVFPTH